MRTCKIKKCPFSAFRVAAQFDHQSGKQAFSTRIAVITMQLRYNFSKIKFDFLSPNAFSRFAHETPQLFYNAPFNSLTAKFLPVREARVPMAVVWMFDFYGNWLVLWTGPCPS